MVFWDDLEGEYERMRGRLKREETDVHIQLIYITVQQNLTQHCKAIIIQFKNICKMREKK